MEQITEDVNEISNPIVNYYDNSVFQGKRDTLFYAKLFAIILRILQICIAAYTLYVAAKEGKNKRSRDNDDESSDEDEDEDDNEDQLSDSNLETYDEEKTVRWKNKEWKKWMNNLEHDWMDFISEINNEKDKWIEKKEKEWNSFLDELENKWNHYNENFDKEFSTNILEDYSNWDDKQWIEWMKTDGIHFIYVQWKAWVLESHSKFAKVFVDKWLEWKKNKILSWSMLDWKRKESQKWRDYEKNTWFKCIYFLSNKRYNEFITRTYEEQNQWNEWTQKKDDKFIENVLNGYLSWKDNKHMLYKQWVEKFVNNWVSKKQWNVWIEEQNLGHSYIN